MTEKNKSQENNVLANPSDSTDNDSQLTPSIVLKESPQVPDDANEPKIKIDSFTLDEPEDETPPLKKQAPENKSEKNMTTDSPPPPQQIIKKGSNTLSLLSLSLIVAMAGGGYYFGEKFLKEYESKISALDSAILAMDNQMPSLKQGISGLTTRIESSENTVNETLERINQQSEQTQTNVTHNESAITSLQNAFAEIQGRRPNDWLLAESNYLVKLAVHQLQHNGDLDTAISLLTTADQRISDLNDPSMLSLRRVIATDIQTLKAVERIDVNGLVSQLLGLQEQVNALPLANAILPEDTAAPEPEKVVSTDVNDWKENLKASFDDFVDQFITYRKREGTVIPQLTPAQHFYLQENIKAKLDQAIIAVYRQNTVVYEETLGIARQWLTDFYDVQAPATSSFIATLDELAGKNILVELPSVIGSQQTIVEIISERSRRAIAAQLNEVDPS